MTKEDAVALEPCPWCDGTSARFQLQTTDGNPVEMVTHHGRPHCCVRRDPMTLSQWNTRVTKQQHGDEVVEALRSAINRELGRQAREAVSMPYVGERYEDEVTVDGSIELTPLAHAILSALQSKGE